MENEVNNNNNNKDKKKRFYTNVLNSPRKKITALAFLLYNPIISTIVGAPIPFPSLIDVSAQHVAFINFLSLLITLVGSIIGIGFYIERRNNLKFDQQNYKMDRLDQKIEKKIEELHNSLRQMESRICNNFDEKITNLERNTEYKVQKAKDIEDERFRRIDEQHREHERRLDRIDNESFRNYSHNIQRRQQQQQQQDNANWKMDDKEDDQ